MATRCEITIKNKDNTITSVYSHFDGYPSYTGRILYEDYKTREEVEKFINNSSYDIEKYDNIDSFLNINNVDYLYLFDNDKWYYVDNYKNKDILPLTEEVIYSD